MTSYSTVLLNKNSIFWLESATKLDITTSLYYSQLHPALPQQTFSFDLCWPSDWLHLQNLCPRKASDKSQTKRGVLGKSETPEPDDGSLHLLQDLADMHHTMVPQGSQVNLAPSLPSSNLANLLLRSSKPGWNPCMACCSPYDVTFSCHEGFHILTMKHTSDFFTIRVQNGSLSRRWLLRTWQNLEASHGFEEWPSKGAGICAGRAFFKKQLGLWHCR